MKITINFYDMTILRYLMIKVDVGYWTIFCVSGG